MTDRPGPPDRARLLVADAERIPVLLAASASRGAEFSAPPGLRRIILTGLGSSRFAALVAEPFLREPGAEVIVEHASTARPARTSPGTLVVGISASGGTPETVEALVRARNGGAATLAITNQPASRLAEAADAVIDLRAGHERSGISACAYVATVATLLQLAAQLGGRQDVRAVLAAGAACAAELLATRPTWLAPAADALDAGVPIHFLADAGSLGTAEQAALMFREGPRLAAQATDAGDWLHVGIYTALPGYRAVLLAGTAYDGALASVMADRGGEFVSVGLAVPGAAATIALPSDVVPDPRLRALVEPLVATLLAAELWRRAVASNARSDALR